MVVDVNTLAIIGERIPPRATGLVMEWAAQNQVELQENAESGGQVGLHLTILVEHPGMPG